MLGRLPETDKIEGSSSGQRNFLKMKNSRQFEKTIRRRARLIRLLQRLEARDPKNPFIEKLKLAIFGFGLRVLDAEIKTMTKEQIEEPKGWRTFPRKLKEDYHGKQ